ncbi:MAG: RNB domain-containing ribonuclease [Chloroflexi bacterium]|nr:RNB domain-containing ribonuclease [Chloroflexota bacterium]
MANTAKQSDSNDNEALLKPNSLLLYKQRPARLVRAGDRLEIELEGGEVIRVRSKDVTLLHEGPLSSLSELVPQEGEVQEAWEILAGEHTNLTELAELIYGSNTPVTAWSAWLQVAEGLYFEGSPGDIRARTVDEVAQKKLERDLAEANRRAWQAFIDRVRRGEIIQEDREFLRDVEDLAMGRTERSQTLRELGRSESPENAHALLLDLGVWDWTVNPYPTRLKVATRQPEVSIPPLPEEDRRDLMHLPAFAIDDQGTDTPDDAISLEGSRLWVHVADVAALVQPDSPLDLEARARGMSLHLPEGTVHMLPREIVSDLGLGLKEVSPALSFGIDLDDQGQVQGFEVVPSWVRVTRLTYQEAELMMGNEPFCRLEKLTDAVRARRRANDAVMIDFPEVKITVKEGQVGIQPILPLRSRAMVEEAMILTGTETARFAVEQKLTLPFTQQEAVDSAARPASLQPETLSEMFALRRLMKRSQVRTQPAPHSGLGVAAYTQVTSPLRRYFDLIAHQQLRAYIKGAEPLNDSAVLERIGASEAVLGSVRQAELLSENHWTLVYLLQHPDWRGEGILVEKRGTVGTVIIPSLALETRIHISPNAAPDSRLILSVNRVNLPQCEVHFRVVDIQ